MDARGARIVRLIQDPELGGDLLLVGLGLAAIYDLGLTYENGIDGIADMLWSGRVHPHQRIRGTFRDDIRTYRRPSPTVYRCDAPMVRRDGRCGKPTSNWVVVTDWATGEQGFAMACSRHRAWSIDVQRGNFAAKPDIVPLPYANSGGILARHFPRVDWPRFWRELDPKWVEHPERQARPRPDFSLVLGDGEGGLAAAPLLSLVPIGGAS